MACPIKDENGNLDPEAMKALVDVGGFLVEGGVRQYGEWAKAMKARVGDVFNNGDLRTIWMNVKADAAERTGFAQSMTEDDAFVQSLARRLGSIRRAADFANDLVGQGGEATIMRKLVDGDPLTKAEAAQVRESWTKNILNRKPGAKPSEGAMGAIQAALDEAKAPTPKQKEPLRPNNGEPEPTGAKGQSNGTGRTPAEAGLREDLSERYQVQPEETAEQAYERMLTRDADSAGQEPGKPTPNPLPKGKGQEEEGLLEQRSEEYRVQPDGGLSPAEHYENQVRAEPPKELEVDEKFDRQMASRLGSREAANQFRSALGPDLYDKVVSEGLESLSPHETDAVTRAFEHFDEQSARDRTVAQTPQAEAMKAIAEEARASLAHRAEEAKLADFAKTRAWVKELLASKLSDKRMKFVGAELDKIQEGDTQALSAAFSRFSPRFFKTPRLYTQGAMLSNPNSLYGTALVSHLMSAGVESTLATQIARGLSGGMHANIDRKLLAHAIATSLTKGNAEAYGLGMDTVGKAIKNRDLGALKREWNPDNILLHGENAATLAGKNSLHEPGSPLHQEITVGAGGKVGNALSTVGRVPGRMHGAAWHAVGVGLDEIARQNAAHYAAIDEMTARGQDWRSKDNRAELRTRTRELYEAPTQKVLETATKLRQEQMFQNPNAMAANLEKMGLAGTPVAPFVKVGGNITGRALEHTPAGAAASIAFHLHKVFKENGIHAGDYLGDFDGFKKAWAKIPSADKAHIAKIAARGIIGAGIYAAGYAGYKKGVVNAPSPGRGEYGSVNVVGHKVEAGRVLGPYSMPLFLGADRARAAEQKRKYNPAGITETMKDMVGAGADNPMTNVGEVANSLTEPPTGKGNKKVAMATKVAGSVLRGEIPSVVSAGAHLTDKTHSMRDVNTDQVARYLWNVMKASTPGAIETLPLKKVKGKTIPDATPWGPWPGNVPAASPAELAKERRDDGDYARQGR
jgi:hypothetical protein